MSDAVYPSLPGLAWPVVKMPQFNTKVQRSVNGREWRAAFMDTPLFTFTLPYGVLRSRASFVELQTLMGFVMARQGSFDSFLYDDPTDDSVTDQTFGYGTGSLDTYQLIRTYGGGGFSASDYAQNINTITNIKNDGTPCTFGVDADEYHYTIADGTTNTIVFGAAPTDGHVLTWTGTYYYRCRFLSDTQEFSQFMCGLWEPGGGLKFVGAPQNKV